MAKDANGVDKIYPSRVGGAEFISDANLNSNGQFVRDGTLVSDGGGVWHMTDYSQCRNTANPRSNYPQEAIGGTSNNFADNLSRGYAMNKDDWNNVEMTEYIQVSSWSPTSSEIIIKGPTGTHHGSGSGCGSPDDCSGGCYGCRTGMENPTNSEFFKEEFHVCYDSRDYKDLPTHGNYKDGNWHGIKFMNYEVIVNGKKCRKLEHWLDDDGDGTGWVKVNETIDQGGWGSNMKHCHAPVDDQVISWANGRAMWRYDATGGTNLKFKWLSCREIDVNGNPDQGTGGGSGGGGGGGTGGGSPSVGPDGVAKIYPDMQGKFIWYMDNSKPFDGHLEKGGGSSYGTIVKNGDGSWKPDKDGTIKFNILVDPGQKDAIGGCKMDFKACLSRLYTRKPNDVGNPGVEMTAFFKMTQAVGNKGIFMRGPWNHHPSSSGLCCQEAEYDVEVLPNGNFSFTKELYGSQEIPSPDSPQQIAGVTDLTTLGWFGLKYIYVIEDTTASSPKIRLELWINKNGDKVTWQKVGAAKDFVGNKWGVNQAVCNGDPYQVYAWAAAGMVIKWYNGHIDFKDWSVRTIDPTGTFENPPPPITCPAEQHLEGGVCVPDSGGTGGGGGGGTPGPPTRVRGFLRLLWDINTVRGGGACQGTGGGGGGPSGTLSKIYDVAANSGKTLSNSTTFNHRTKIVQVINSSTSTLVGQLVKQADIQLKKTGSPIATEKIHAKIWSSTGGVVYTSATALDPSTLTTSYAATTFDFSTNTHVLQNGDKIGVEWKGTSDTDYVVGSYDDDTVPNSFMSNYEGTSYDDHTDRDMSMTLWA